MNWYYVANGQQVGPLSEADFQAGVKAGAITPTTLVWREGMAQWQPYAEVAQTATPAPAGMAVATTEQVTCSECRREFPADAVISVGAAKVCASCKPLFLQKMREGGTVAGELDYAGFWLRVGAKLIDGLILAVVSIVLFIPVGMMAATRDAAAAILAQVVIQLVGMAVSCGYSTFFLGKFGATPGKMAVKLKVVTPEGAPISYGRAFGRFWAEILSAMICYIGYLMVAFDKEEHRALHDRICNTRVVRR